MNFTWELIARQDLTELESYFNFEATIAISRNMYYYYYYYVLLSLLLLLVRNTSFM